MFLTRVVATAVVVVLVAGPAAPSASSAPSVPAVAAAPAMPAAPAARATPVSHGSIRAGADLTPFCDEAAGCESFFAAHCPDALVVPDGATSSIVDISSLARQTVTFGWSDVGTDLYDQYQPTLGSFTPRSGAVYVLVTGSCETPAGFPTFILGTLPDWRTKTFTIPDGSRWLIAWASPGTANITWWLE